MLCGVTFLIYQCIRVLNKDLKFDTRHVMVLQKYSWNIQGYIGDTMIFSYGICANIKWISSLVLKDVIPSSSNSLHPYPYWYPVWHRYLYDIGCWYHLCLYHSGVYNEDFTFFDTSRVWTFDGICVSIPLGSISHARTFILAKIALVSIWFKMVLTQIITQVCNNSHLEIPTK